MKFTFSGIYDSIKPYRLATGSSDKESAQLESWNDYLKRIAAVSTIDGNLYDSPNGKILNKKPNRNHFKIIEIKDDWASVSSKIWEQDTIPDGWIQWKKNNQLNITIIEMFLE